MGNTTTVLYILLLQVFFVCCFKFPFLDSSGEDQCATKCSNHSRCLDFGCFGVYCSCLPGYTGNGTICEDINECETGSDVCPDDITMCVNTQGSYICISCPFGVKDNLCIKANDVLARLQEKTGDEGSGDDNSQFGTIQPSMSGDESTAMADSISTSATGLASEDASGMSSMISSTPSVAVESSVANLTVDKQSAVRVEGPTYASHARATSLQLCCQLHENLPNTTITWYHNGEEVEGNDTLLQLHNISGSESGFYQCAVNLTGQLLKSTVKRVHVTDDEETQCQIETETRFVPNECPTGKQDNSVDVQYCAEAACREEGGQTCGQEEKDGKEAMCCSPTEYKKILIPCYGFSMGMVSPVHCQCKPCDGKVAAGMTLKGQVLDRSERFPLRFGKVFMNGEEVAETDILGSFTLVLDKSPDRVVLTFTDSRFATFHESTKVLHLKTNKKFLFYTFYSPLLQKEMADIDDDMVILYFRNNMMARISVPETRNLQDLKVYGNVVSQSIYGSAYKDVMGDSSAVDEDGVPQPLHVLLLFCLTLMDGSDKILDAAGPYTFHFSRDELAKLLDSAPDLKDLWLFGLSPDTGYWSKIAAVPKDNNAGRNSDAFVSVQADLTGNFKWFTIASIDKACILKVGSPLNRARERAYSELLVFKTPVMAAATWSSVSSALVTGSNTYCLLTACGIHSLVIADRAGKETRMRIDIQRSASSGDGRTNSTGVASRFETLEECTDSKSFDIITSSRDDDVIMENSITYLEATSVALLQELPPEDLYMAWYPMAYGDVYTACFIKIHSQCSDTTAVTVLSFPTKMKRMQGQLYGMRASAPRDGDMCVEYKCSGTLYTQIDNDVTLIEITLADVSGKCHASEINPFLLRRVRQETPGVEPPLRPGYLRMHMPANAFGSLYGLYSATSQTSAEEARDAAWKHCVTGSDPNDLSPPPAVQMGAAVTFGAERLNLAEADENQLNQ